MTGWGRSSTRWPRAVGLGVVLLVVAACSSAQSAAPAASTASPSTPAPPGRVSLNTAYTTASATVAPLWTALEGDAFAEQDLDVQMTFISAGQAILGAVSSEEAPIVVAGANQVIDADLQGGSYLLLGSAMPYLTNSIYVVPSIQTPDDLRGKTVGVSNYGAISDVALHVALEHWGLQPDTDVTIVRTGGTPETLAAMQSGEVQGGSFSPPQTFKAGDLGFRQLIDVATLHYEMGSSAIVSSRDYVGAHPDVTERYLKAMIKGAHLFETNADLAISAIMKYGRVDDREIAQETWNYYRDKVSDDMAMSPQAVENNLKLLADHQPAAATAKPDQFLDSSFVDRLKASGYVEQVQQGS
ncbi:MAG TPA: ABC transporter substrate-binding protein [Chloroflexota bacterium]|nr:ABC transporter substrate-binding protein [Chloroflexota bacterium]